jgi:organic radical activating enzyme
MKKLTSTSYPNKFTLEIYLTEKCSYACRYCQLHTPKVQFTPLDFDKLFSRDYSDADVYIYGGEPLIHPELNELLSRLKGDITIQSNLSISERRIEELLDNHDVYISPSFHYEEADVNEFLSKMALIHQRGRLREASVMWISDHDAKIYIIYKMFKERFGDVWLDPTLPWTKDLRDWQDKVELKKFADKYPADITKNFGQKIIVDGVEKTVLQSYVDNDDLSVCGMTCRVGDYRICYDGHLNEWRGCTSDIIFRNNSEGVCKNTVCLLDLRYDKSR